MSIRRILIVDDDVDVRSVVSLAVRRLGNWEVALAASGEEGLEKARSEQPDLILLDVMMRGTDGPATLRLLREDPATARIPVIFLTARAQPHELEQYLGLGAIGVIVKPFDVMKLVDEIVRLFEAAEVSDFELDRELASLKAGYRLVLPERLAELEALLGAAKAVPGRESFDAARRVAHTLMGSSGSYGFDALCRELRRIELGLEGLLGESPPDFDEAWPEIERAFAQARTAFAAA